MVLYGLHYSWLTKANLRQIDAWQARTIRRTLSIKASMISRYTNAYVLEQATTTPLSTQLIAAQVRYFGHVLRAAERQDLIYKVCFSNAGVPRLLSSKHKQAHPYDKWTPQMLRKVGEHFHQPRPYTALKMIKLAGTKEYYSWGRVPTCKDRPAVIQPRIVEEQRSAHGGEKKEEEDKKGPVRRRG
jgi:hypothetical protein